MSGIIKQIKLNELINYFENPRHEIGTNEVDTLKKLVSKVGIQYMINLASDIQENGLLQNLFLVVVYSEKLKKYVVYEGNRRIAAIKMLTNTDLFSFLDKASLSRIKAIKDKGFNLTKLSCYVTDEEEAFFIMERMHSGQDSGKGLKEWTAKEKNLFKVRRNNEKGISFLIDFYTKKYLDGFDITSILPYTTIQRLFNNTSVRKEIGIDVNDEKSFTPERIILIKEASVWVAEESKKRGLSVTRFFNKAETIKSELLPWIIEKKNETTATRDSKSNENSTDKDSKNSSPNNSNKRENHNMGRFTVRSLSGLLFTKQDIAIIDSIYNHSNLGNKIRQLSYEISTLRVNDYCCSICGLYRSLLECSTRFFLKNSNCGKVFDNKKNLEENIICVLNVMGQQNSTQVKAWRELVTKRKLIDILNGFMHDENAIDLDFIQETWKTIKPYIIACVGLGTMKND